VDDDEEEEKEEEDIFCFTKPSTGKPSKVLASRSL
jgi:hypothetical protein